MPAITTTERANYVFQQLPGGVRRTVHYHGNGESWTSYLAVPRELVNKMIRRNRRAGIHYNECHWWRIIPEPAVNFIRSVGYGGPGMPFVHEPVFILRKRFVIVVQFGGLDV